MGFEQPGYLWGVLAAAIPLLIHLISRRRAKVIDFPAIDFVLRSNKQIARRLKLRQWMLMALRMALLAAVPLAFAKPFTTSTAAELTVGSTPGSVVIVIDPSFSMGYQPEGQSETLLEKARKKARDVLGELRAESDAAVVVASSPPRSLTPTLVFDKRPLLSELDRIELEHSAADLQGALRLAEQMLVTSGQPRRRVVLLSDLQASEWEGITRPWSLDRAPDVTVVDLLPKDEHGNVAITSVLAVPESGGLGRDVRVKVAVLNDRPQPFEDVITVRVGDRTAKSILKIPPRQTGEKEFTVRVPEAGPAMASSSIVEIPADRLPGDNKLPFTIDFLRRVHVLVVNGAPRTVPYKDETFFLRAALRPGREPTSRINPTYVKPDELAPSQLAYVDVVVLANVGLLDPPQVQGLLQWVKGGGGLFITVGDNVQPDIVNTTMRELLPLPLREVRAAEVGADGQPKNPLYFAGVETTHPLLRPFAHLPDASLYLARTGTHTLLDTVATEGTRVLMSYSDGSPALVERTLGQGRSLLLTTSIDRDWTDLPFRTSFLPLIQQTMLYLGGKLDRPRDAMGTVGEVRVLPVGRDDVSIEVTRPDGRVVTFAQGDLATGDVRFHETGLAGVYRVRHVRKQGGEEEQFVMHVDPRESVLRTLDRAWVETLLRSGQAPAVAEVMAPIQAPPQRKGEIWPMLLVAMFFLLGFETWFAFSKA